MRRADGGTWREPNLDPTNLTADDVDSLVWSAVQKINQSGWIWTTESCQGHGEHSAYLGLITDDLGRLMRVLADVVFEGQDARIEPNRHDPSSWPITLQFHRIPRMSIGAYQLRLTVIAPQDAALKIINSLAYLVTEARA